MKFVLDASLTLSWCFDNERTEFTHAVLGAVPRVGAVVPSLWSYEVANGLRTAVKTQRLPASTADQFVATLRPLPIDTVRLTKRHIFGNIRAMALEHSITVYDATYLALSSMLDLPLATLDGSGKRTGLKQAAGSRGVTLVDLPMAIAWQQ